MGLLLSKLSSLHHAVQSHAKQLCCGAELLSVPWHFHPHPASDLVGRGFPPLPFRRLSTQAVHIDLQKRVSSCLWKQSQECCGQDMRLVEEDTKRRKKVVLATRIYTGSA